MRLPPQLPPVGGWPKPVKPETRLLGPPLQIPPVDGMLSTLGQQDQQNVDQRKFTLPGMLPAMNMPIQQFRDGGQARPVMPIGGTGVGGKILNMHPGIRILNALRGSNIRRGTAVGRVSPTPTPQPTLPSGGGNTGPAIWGEPTPIPSGGFPSPTPTPSPTPSGNPSVPNYLDPNSPNYSWLINDYANPQLYTPWADPTSSNIPSGPSGPSSGGDTSDPSAPLGVGDANPFDPGGYDAEGPPVDPNTGMPIPPDVGEIVDESAAINPAADSGGFDTSGTAGTNSGAPAMPVAFLRNGQVAPGGAAQGGGGRFGIPARRMATPSGWSGAGWNTYTGMGGGFAGSLAAGGGDGSGGVASHGSGGGGSTGTEGGGLGVGTRMGFNTGEISGAAEEAAMERYLASKAAMAAHQNAVATQTAVINPKDYMPKYRFYTHPSGGQGGQAHGLANLGGIRVPNKVKVGGFSFGGKVKGKPNGIDSVPAMLSPGEVVFTPEQLKNLKIVKSHKLRPDQVSAIKFAKKAA